MRTHASQSGAVLAISLIMLLLMTLIGLAGMRTTVLEEKMAGNLSDLNLAFEATESALREGEAWIDDLPKKYSDPVPQCEVALDAFNPTDIVGTWGTTDVCTYAGVPVVPNVATQPEYYVEHELRLKDSLNLGTQNDDTGRDLYRVTGRGTGGSATTQAIARTTYARRF